MRGSPGYLIEYRKSWYPPHGTVPTIAQGMAVGWPADRIRRTVPPNKTGIKPYRTRHYEKPRASPRTSIAGLTAPSLRTRCKTAGLHDIIYL